MARSKKDNGEMENRPAPSRDGYERQEETFLSFNRDGQWIQGVFLWREERTITDKRSGKPKDVALLMFDVKDSNGFEGARGLVGVWGSTDIEKKIKPDGVGHMYIVERTGERIPTNSGDDMVVYHVDKGGPAKSDHLPMGGGRQRTKRPEDAL